MRKHTTTVWLLAACGWLAGPAAAGEPGTVLNADAVFGPGQQNFVQQVSCNCGCTNGYYSSGGRCGSGCSMLGGGCGGGDLGDPWTLSSLMGDDPCFDVGGWFQAGYHNNSTGVFNTYPHQVQLHQGWVYLEKATDGSDGLDFGGRVDLMYGTDGPNTQAFGNPLGVFDYSDTFSHGDLPASSRYGWAIPQLYGEVAYHDWTVRAGHYYTMHGYEVVPATGNFFYSHAFTMNFSEAFTHTGVHAAYAASDNAEIYLGWSAGWDTGFSQLNSGNIFHGGFKVTPVDDIAFVYITSVGNLGWLGEGYTHSILLDFTLTDKLQFITQSDLVHTNIDPFGASDGYNTIGWNNYLIYWATDRVGVGARAEWWKAQVVSYYETTAAVNITPHANFVIRPEIRYQWSPAGNDDPTRNPVGLPLEQGIFGVDAILTF